MFMGVAVKAGLDTSRRRMPKSRRQVLTKLDRQSEQELARWVVEPEQMRFYGAGEMLYACRREHYDALEAMSGTLSVIYSGVAMGQIFKGRLRPDGALAFYVGLNRKAVACCEVEAEVALQYLRKQDVEAEPFAEGLNLVLHDGQALGFVKRVGARVNNMYPSSLRILK
jgi:NOL1/NOP2/fmu family ribosome biogenesis protein